MTLTLTNARVVTATTDFLGSVHIENGLIQAIDEGVVSLPSAIDLEGDWLMPGLVEIHTDNLEKHLMPRPGVNWPSRSAFLIHDAQLAASGITTALDGVVLGDIEAKTPRGLFLEASLEAIRGFSDADLSRVDHFLHLRCELANQDVWEHYESLVGLPLVKLISLMDHTPGQRQWRDISKYRQYSERHGRMTDAEFDALVAERRYAQEHFAAPLRVRITEDARSRGMAMASHDDTTEDHIEQAHAEGIFISEFPTTEEASRAAHAHQMVTVLGAPNVVQGGSHSGNVSAMDMAKAGLLDALSSDYVPASLLEAAFLFMRDAQMAPAQAVSTISLAPARMVGFHDRGEIAQGLRADLIRVRQGEGQMPPAVLQTWRKGQRVA